MAVIDAAVSDRLAHFSRSSRWAALSSSTAMRNIVRTAALAISATSVSDGSILHAPSS